MAEDFDPTEFHIRPVAPQPGGNRSVRARVWEGLLGKFSQARRDILSRIVGETGPQGRPMIQNPDGTVSTELTFTKGFTGPDGQDFYMNIPSLFRGKRVTEDEAIGIIKQHGGVDPETGRTLERFKSVEEAVQAAEKRTQDLDQQIKDRRHQNNDHNDEK